MTVSLSVKEIRNLITRDTSLSVRDLTSGRSINLVVSVSKNKKNPNYARIPVTNVKDTSKFLKNW